MVKDLCFEIIESCPNECKFCSSNSCINKKQIISFNDYKVLLIPAGYNLYYLAYTNDKKIPLNCILYSFMLDNNCHIDITKYNYIYKGIYIILNTYKKA